MKPNLPGVRVPEWAVAPGEAGQFGELLARVWALPKVELHLHLEGTLRPETVCDLARRHEPESPFCDGEWHRGYWTFRDLATFVIEFGQVLRTCVRTPEDYYRLAREALEDLAAQQVVYAEISVGPRVPGRPYYVPADETLAAIDQARREVEVRTSLRASLIIGLSRNHLIDHDLGPEALALQYVREALRARDSGAAVAGIDLHGDEQGWPQVAPFVPAFRLAEEAGLGLRAHAGEGGGPEVVWESLRELRVGRIAHGVRASEDATLVKHLAGAQVALDMCPVSNVLTGAARSLAEHPARAFDQAGVAITISSDDPVAFNTSVTTDLALLGHHQGFSLADLGRLNVQAAQHAFLLEPARAALVDRLRLAWPRGHLGRPKGLEGAMMAQAKRVRVGLIGLGNNMQGHIRRLVEMSEVEIVAGVDPVEASQARLRERFPQLASVPLFKDHQEMLRSVQPQAVEISTPHSFHFKQIVDSLEAGAHVLVEKPMVNSVRQAEEVIRRRDASGKVVLVSYQRHTQPTFVKMKQLIDDGAIGKVEMIVALQNQQWYANKFRTPELPWRVHKNISGGGQLNDSGSHLIDILLHVTDLEPEVVFASQQSFKLEVDVNSAITVQFAGGAMGNISIVGQAPGIGGAVWEDVTIYGSEGALFYRMMGQPEFKPTLELRKINQNEPVDVGPLPTGSTPDQNYIDAILGRSRVKSPAECGLRVMQLSEAAWQSAENGRPVEVRALSGSRAI